MTKDEYQEYLRTAHWKQLSRSVISSRKKCENCAFPYELNAHHKTYERVGRERWSDLVVLCRSCHARHHFIEHLDDNDCLAFFIKTKAVRDKIATQVGAAREKNIDREHEIQNNRERESE